MTEWAQHALEALERGERVFPLLDKHVIPVKWGTEATTRAEVVERWAAQFPRATGYGIALRADQYVFDADTPAAVEWCRSNMPPTYEVGTGRAGGGVHFYFHVPNGRRLRMLNTRLGVLVGVDGLDGKTMGGYVVGPGSVHKSGARYTVLTDHRPAGPHRPAALPSKMVKRIGDRPEPRFAGGSDEAPTAGELAEWEANAAWGRALRAEAVDDARHTARNLRRFCELSDERWADAFLEAGLRLGMHVPSGALTWQEAVDFLDGLFQEVDAWGVPGNVERSIRRGVTFGARQEQSAWL